jgi:predicted Zn finger-like uncharacterized protein
MILQCPECQTRYLVPDSAIGVAGRTVRCANCRHSWFQEPALELTPPPPVPGATRDTDADAEDPPFPVAAPPAPSAWAEPEPVSAPAPPTRGRRNPARLWTVAAAVAGALMLAAVVAILWLGGAGLTRQLGLPWAQESPLRLVDDPIQRRELPNGSELFAVSGRIVNPSGEAQRVPDIRAELRDAQGRIVYGWTITPQRRSLGPGEQVDFNSAKLDVPASSKRLELSFAGGAAGT